MFEDLGLKYVGRSTGTTCSLEHALELARAFDGP